MLQKTDQRVSPAGRWGVGMLSNWQTSMEESMVGPITKYLILVDFIHHSPCPKPEISVDTEALRGYPAYLGSHWQFHGKTRSKSWSLS